MCPVWTWQDEALNGDNSYKTKSGERTEIQGAWLHAMSVVWQTSRGISQVQDMSYMFSDIGQRRQDPRSQKGQLVAEYEII